MVIPKRGRVALFLTVVAVVLTLAACGGKHAAAASSAEAHASAVATAPAVLAARQKAITTVVNPCKTKLPDLSSFKSCAEGRMGISGTTPAAKAKRGAFESCLFEAAAADNILHASGRTKFETAGAPDCASQVMS